MQNKKDIIEEVLYWLEHTTMSREAVIDIFKDKLKEINNE